MNVVICQCVLASHLLCIVVDLSFSATRNFCEHGLVFHRLVPLTAVEDHFNLAPTVKTPIMLHYLFFSPGGAHCPALANTKADVLIPVAIHQFGPNTIAGVKDGGKDYQTSTKRCVILARHYLAMILDLPVRLHRC